MGQSDLRSKGTAQSGCAEWAHAKMRRIVAIKDEKGQGQDDRAKGWAMLVVSVKSQFVASRPVVASSRQVLVISVIGEHAKCHSGFL